MVLFRGATAFSYMNSVVDTAAQYIAHHGRDGTLVQLVLNDEKKIKVDMKEQAFRQQTNVIPVGHTYVHLYVPPRFASSRCK